ncbi:MAG: hypothetical protein IPM60_09715 [Rhodospirillales bacterium]|nr:hypothetical protein [Rhodospirillales bacterium]
MANIQKRERKTGTVYLADVRIHGFPRQKKTFKRLTDAKLWAQQTEAAIRKGEFQNVVSTARSKTLNDVIERYRDDVLPHKAPSTQRAETTYLAFWERELGKYALSYIEPQLISAKLRELGEAGDGRRKADDGETAKPVKTALKTPQDPFYIIATRWLCCSSMPNSGAGRRSIPSTGSTRSQRSGTSACAS